MIEWVTIKIFANRFEAELVKSVLEGHNIAAQILADGIPASYTWLHMSEGVKLQVSKEQVDEARELLATGF